MIKKHLRGKMQTGGLSPEELMWGNAPELPHQEATQQLWHNDDIFNQNLDEANQYHSLPQQPSIQKKTDKVDPYFAMKGIQNGLSWLSGVVDRGRQNQYMQQQLSTLGQLNPIPVSNFQPNPFSIYAQYGGSIKKYQAGGRTPIKVTNPNDPRLKSGVYTDPIKFKAAQQKYNDSLYLHNVMEEQVSKWMNGKTEVKSVPKSMANTMLNENWAGIPQNIIDKAKQSNILPTGSYWGYESMPPFFKKPTQVPVYKKPEPVYPIHHLQPAVKGTINIQSPQQEQIPEPNGQPVYGPSNGLIGYQTSTGFQPTMRRDHLAKANQADIDLLNNPEALQKYVKDNPRFKKGGWLKGAVDPAHKGWCTPLSNPHCTGHRRAFALMMKKNHGFHKK